MAGLFSTREKLTKEQKRHRLYRDRFRASQSPTDMLRHAVDYVRAVHAVMEPVAQTQMAQRLFEYAAKANGTDGE